MNKARIILQKFLILFLAIFAASILLSSAAAVTAHAQEAASGSAQCGVYDKAELLSSDEESRLTDMIEEYTQKYNLDLAIVTTNDTGSKTTADYAETYAEKIGMSMKHTGYPGALFLIDMDNRQLYISICGTAIEDFTSSEVDTTLEKCKDHIYDSYYETCTAFLDGAAKYAGPRTIGTADILIALGIAAAAGAALTLIMVHNAGGKVTTSGATYINDADTKVLRREDRFRNKVVTRRHLPRSDGKGGGGGGDFHVSSGGGEHGGGGVGF